MKRKFYKRKQGFMLIELSIALVVIGLLFAGISGGTALIENAKVRATLSQIESIKNAALMFNAEYGLPPGGLQDTLDYFPNAIFTAAPTGSAATDLNATCSREGSDFALSAEGTGNTTISGVVDRGAMSGTPPVFTGGQNIIVSTIAMCQLHAGRYVDLPMGSKVSTGNVEPGEHAPKMKLSGASSIVLITDANDNLTMTLGNTNLGSTPWTGTHVKIGGNIAGELLKKLDQKLSTGTANTGSFTATKTNAAAVTAANKCDYNSKTQECVATFKIIE